MSNLRTAGLIFVNFCETDLSQHTLIICDPVEEAHTRIITLLDKACVGVGNVACRAL